MSTVRSIKGISTGKSKQTKQEFAILIVDDDQIIGETFGEILESRGHNVSIALDSASCINKCQNYRYDIIFMDFHMDNVNGVDMTDLLKNVCNNTSIIFAITGDDSKKAIEQFKNIGMDGAIIKPINIDLINKLMGTLETRIGIDKRVIKTISFPTHKNQLMIFDKINN